VSKTYFRTLEATSIVISCGVLFFCLAVEAIHVAACRDDRDMQGCVVEEMAVEAPVLFNQAFEGFFVGDNTRVAQPLEEAHLFPQVIAFELNKFLAIQHVPGTEEIADKIMVFDAFDVVRQDSPGVFFRFFHFAP